MKPIERGNMKNLVAVLALVTFVAGCTEDRVTVFHNNDRVTDLERRVDLLEVLTEEHQRELDSVNEQLGELADAVDIIIDDLDATQDQLDQQGVQLFKCDSLSSTERIMKINGKFYAVMNRVTTKNVQVVTGSSSTTVTTPDMCKTFLGDLQLPNSGGQCTPNSGPFKSTKIPGQTITIPSYTTATVTVVDSVKIALDILTDGNYTTTDGGTACSFSISGGGTVASGLIPVQ